MDKMFNIEMKLEKSGKYKFKIKNPRDDDGLIKNAEDFVRNKVSQNDDVFSWGDLMDDFSDAKNIGKKITVYGSYERGYDLEMLWFRVDTKDYMNYTVEFELYSGRPHEEFHNHVINKKPEVDNDTH
jgi:hypothetical protein